MHLNLHRYLSDLAYITNICKYALIILIQLYRCTYEWGLVSQKWKQIHITTCSNFIINALKQAYLHSFISSVIIVFLHDHALKHRHVDTDTMMDSNYKQRRFQTIFAAKNRKCNFWRLLWIATQATPFKSLLDKNEARTGSVLSHAARHTLCACVCDEPL